MISPWHDAGLDRPAPHKHLTLPAACVLVVSIVLCGCGGSNPHGPLVPVKGQITLAGKPLAGGTITLLSLADADKGAPVASGTTDAQGSYSLTSKGSTGAPLGKWGVTIDPGDPDRDLFDNNYSDWRNTPLKIEVVEKPAAGAYDFKLVARKR